MATGDHLLESVTADTVATEAKRAAKYSLPIGTPCPNCKTTFPDDANFCPEESCATASGPQRLQAVADAPAARFQPIAQIGGASTGEVWRARDNDSGAEVAYKVVAAGVLPNPAAFARAERELKQLLRVRSPKIASVLDVGKTADDRLYVATEICEGETLERILKNGPLPLEKAKNIVAQIGLALLEAQKVGVVHRDVAPKNVLVSSSGDVRVINFAVAQAISDKVAGVAAYLSPEQAQGKPADQRSNTYSLAAIFYHLVTGEPPFQGTTVQAILDLHISSPPLPPSQRRPDGNLSPELDRVILKALDKSASRRHLTLRLFLSEVETLASAAPAAPSGAGATGSQNAGFAKTMLFAGGQAEVANLVAKAIAARGAAPATATSSSPAVPVTAPARAAAPTIIASSSSPAMPATSPSRAAAPTIFAAPPTEDPALSRLTPPPVTPYPPSVAAPTAMPAAGADAAKGAKFRETLWFKKGDVDHMIAEAKAKMGGAAAPPNALEVEPEVPAAAAAVEDERPIEDRYVDDGTVTVEDRKKFSLRAGGTATALPAVARAVPGERLSEQDMVGEMGGPRRTMILVVVGVLVAAVLGVVFSMMRGKEAEPAKAAAAAPAAAPVPKPAAPVPAVAPAPAAEHPKTVAAPEKAKPAEPAPAHRVVHRKGGDKKHKR